MNSEVYPVYKVKSDVALPDPHMPPGRLHHAIFVQTETDGSGTLYNVVGDITSLEGMKFEVEMASNPRALATFHSEELLGFTHSDTHPERWISVLGSLPTPPQQKAANPSKQGRVEPFKEKVKNYQYIFYQPGEQQKPLWKCTEWTEQYAIPALQDAGLLRQKD